MPSGDACQTQVCQNSVGFPDCSADLRTRPRTFLPPGLLVYIALELAPDREKHQTDSPASTEGETGGGWGMVGMRVGGQRMRVHSR